MAKKSTAKKKNIKKKNTKNKNNKKIVQNVSQTILLSAVVCIVVYAIYAVAKFAIKPSDSFIIEQGTISKTEALEGYVIRDEQIITNQDSTSQLVEIKGETEKVAKGEQVFRYKTADEDNIINQINELNNQIQEAMEGQTNILLSDVTAIEGQIDKILEKTIGENDIQSIAEYKKEITNYMTKKSKIAGEQNPGNEYINGLINQRTNLENELSSKSNYEIAPMSGVVSYRVDGLEEELTPNTLQDLTGDYLASLNLKTGQIVSKNESTGKVINSFECYIAVSRDANETNEIEVGDKINLRILTDKTVKATVYSIKDEGDTKLIIFKIMQNVEDLVKYRKIDLDIIWWEKEGLKVPHSAIIYENGLSYVVRNRAGTKSKILVKIINENDNYSIIDNYSTEELKQLGFSAEDINNMRNIKLYDEILLNPELKDVN